MQQLYPFIKEFHSGFRWIVLVLAIAAVIDFAMGWFGKRQYKRLDNIISLAFVSAIDIQFLLGLLLYFFLSPITQSAMHFGGYQLEDPNVRFYAIEHPLTMFIAIIFAHMGRILSKKGKTDIQTFQRGTIWFALSLIFMLARMPW